MSAVRTPMASLVAASANAALFSHDSHVRIEHRLRNLGALSWARSFCVENGAQLSEVISAGRVQRVARVRHRLWSVLRDTLGLSYPDVGRIFECDHTTALAADRKHRARLAKEHGR